MAETTQTAPQTETPSSSAQGSTRSWAYCAWHKAYSDTTRLVQLEDAGSGFGVPGLFACAPCREVHGLVPLADRP
ncbi:hypothetical protein [Streptomyces sediminimaris]|uniref:hypothetical protein n=1 Tax=Streptomyces sediminimaris TaxID=3383721 RepID=UPI00399AED02